MKRRSTPRFQPRLEALEDRCTPSTTPALAPFREILFQPPTRGAATEHFSPGREIACRRMETITIPFSIIGNGPAPGGLPLVPGESAPHQATGVASLLGRYTGAGTLVLGSLEISATGAVTGTFEGTFVFVAANGDRLATTYGDGFTGTFTGQLSADGTAVTNVRFDAIFTPDPAHSTGRFAQVTGGSWEMIARAESVSLIAQAPGFTAPFNYTWSGHGALEFSRGR